MSGVADVAWVVMPVLFVVFACAIAFGICVLLGDVRRARARARRDGDS